MMACPHERLVKSRARCGRAGLLLGVSNKATNGPLKVESIQGAFVKCADRGGPRRGACHEIIKGQPPFKWGAQRGG